MLLRFLQVLMLVFLSGLLLSPLHAKDSEVFRKNTVRINVIKKEYSFESPWQQPRISKMSGSGFVVGKNLILTNAHVVHNAVLIRIKLSTDVREYAAQVKFIANDCDLALLETVENEFTGSQIMSIGELPEPQSSVSVYGYPIGGDRLSITKGVVSRIDFGLYSFSGVDRHLVIQVDAAINPGNSGGPAIQNGKVIGVAFQGLRQGEGLGYLIPATVIKHFLNDIKDGKYDGFPDFGVSYQSTAHSSLRNALQLDKILKNQDFSGVYVDSVIPGSTAYGYLFPGDILLSINGFPISSFGEIKRKGKIYPFEQLIEESYQKDKIDVEVLRSRKKFKYSLPVRKIDIASFKKRNNTVRPPFVLYGNLIFQPLSADLLGSLVRKFFSQDLSEVYYRYKYYLKSGIYREVDEDVLLTHVLPDKTEGVGNLYQYNIVYRINGVRIKNFKNFTRVMDEGLQDSEYIRLDFLHKEVPLFLSKKQMMASYQRILPRYSFQEDRYQISEIKN